MEFKEIGVSSIGDGVVQEIYREEAFAEVAVDNIEEDLPSWSKVGEIDLERARYLLSADEMFEEMLSV